VANRAISDHHVHTEWSWDAPNGSMEDSCRRAVEFGIPALAFTDHADWIAAPRLSASRGISNA
jgi:histidinol-phosphatase (PHP family)